MMKVPHGLIRKNTTWWYHNGKWIHNDRINEYVDKYWLTKGNLYQEHRYETKLKNKKKR